MKGIVDGLDPKLAAVALLPLGLLKTICPLPLTVCVPERNNRLADADTVTVAPPESVRPLMIPTPALFAMARSLASATPLSVPNVAAKNAPPVAATPSACVIEIVVEVVEQIVLLELLQRRVRTMRRQILPLCLSDHQQLLTDADHVDLLLG